MTEPGISAYFDYLLGAVVAMIGWFLRTVWHRQDALEQAQERAEARFLDSMDKQSSIFREEHRALRDTLNENHNNVMRALLDAERDRTNNNGKH